MITMRRRWIGVVLLLGLFSSQHAFAQQVCKLFRYDTDFNAYGWPWSGYEYNSPAAAGAAALENCQALYNQDPNSGPCGTGGSGWYWMTFSLVSATESWITLLAQGSHPYYPNYAAYVYAQVQSTNCSPPEFSPTKDACGGLPGSCSTIGNPINVARRAKVQLEKDYDSAGPAPLRFERRYDTNGPNDTPYLPDRTLGNKWRHNYDRVVVANIDGFSNRTGIVRPDGRVLHFYLSSGSWVPDADIEEVLTRTTDGSGNHTGWTYKTTESAWPAAGFVDTTLS